MTETMPAAKTSISADVRRSFFFIFLNGIVNIFIKNSKIYHAGFYVFDRYRNKCPIIKSSQRRGVAAAFYNVNSGRMKFLPAVAADHIFSLLRISFLLFVTYITCIKSSSYNSVTAFYYKKLYTYVFDWYLIIVSVAVKYFRYGYLY